MRRGTTPTHTFSLPFSVETISALRITYAQNGEIVMNKTEGDVTAEGQEISVTLTQEETLKFSDKSNVEIQLKILSTSGDVLASPVYTVHPLRIIDEEVLK
jgi:hypothetical protein